MQASPLSDSFLREVLFQSDALHIAGEQQLSTKLLSLFLHARSFDDWRMQNHTLWVWF